MTDSLAVRQMRPDDPPTIAEAFRSQGWNKPQEQYERYYREQTTGVRTVLVAETDGEFVELGREFAGYLTIVWDSGDAPSRSAGIPEIVDLNVLVAKQRNGIGTRLMDEAERMISARSTVAGIGVGLYADYGPAQIMYVKRGYVPDGRGVEYDGRQLRHGDGTTVDDSLCMHFTKDVSTQEGAQP
jgi:GNAT superfamily N-acetyltransferase